MSNHSLDFDGLLPVDAFKKEGGRMRLHSGGGGGGGLFGGGGGGGGNGGAYRAGAGGGGGSSYAGGGATGVVHTQGIWAGHGQVVITW